ncbi:MAG: outer membrane beta-barrel protein [Opitutaceae bacterium]|jgi:hypothetical protein
MIKNLSKISGVTAIVAAVAATASAEVKINENLSLDGYAIGSFKVVEPTTGANDTFLDSGSNLFDAAKVALNGKYGDFSGKVSLIYVPGKAGTEAGILDAYLTYTVGEVSITAGKFNSWMGYESFDSPNNAFIDYGLSGNFGYAAGYNTGVKVEYITKEFATGVSARDSLTSPGKFYQGDGEINDDIGYEAYFAYTGIDKLTLWAGVAAEDVSGTTNDVFTYDLWASYAVTDKLSLAAEYAHLEDTSNYSWLLQATYAFTEKFSGSARVTGVDGDKGVADGFGYGIAGTYTITENFSVKGEVSKTDFDGGAVGDPFLYAIQGLFRF